MVKPYIVQDKYFKKAKQEGFLARSTYKLQQIDATCHLLKKGDTVLDLGAAPGSFLQYTSKVVGSDGYILGLDLQKIEFKSENVATHVCDIFDNETSDALITDILKQRKTKSFDVVLSDLAPKTSGRKDVDQWKSVELCAQVVEIAKKNLRKGGNLLMKIFQGEDFDEFYASIKTCFEKIKIMKPDAVRDRSKEVYLVCIHKK